MIQNSARRVSCAIRPTVSRPHVTARSRTQISNRPIPNASVRHASFIRPQSLFSQPTRSIPSNIFQRPLFANTVSTNTLLRPQKLQSIFQNNVDDSRGLKTRKMSRHSKHRKSLWKTMTTQLIKHERICTTLVKAKEIRRFADRMVTIGKKGTFNARRQAAAFVTEPLMVEKLFEVFPQRYKERMGGYTRIYPLGRRKSDGAKTAIIEFVDNHHPTLDDLKPPTAHNPKVYTPLYKPGTKEFVSLEEQLAWKEKKLETIKRMESQLEEKLKLAEHHYLFPKDRVRANINFTNVLVYKPPPMPANEKKAKGL